jgi:hypothetical protein
MLETCDYSMFFDICLKYPAKKPIICRKTKIWGDWRTRTNLQCKITTFKDRCFKFCANFSEMKKKSNGMSPDMFRDATPSNPIPVVTPVEGTKNDLQNPLHAETEDFTGVGKPTPVKLQAEIIKIDFDKQTVSARALYDF